MPANLYKLVTRIISAAVGLCLLGGCAAQPVTLDLWRSSVEKYIDNVGQGDPNALRDVTWPRSNRSFSVIGQAEPLSSQDGNGVLLASSEIGGQHWFIFLVGIVNKQVVRDIRVAAMRTGPGRRTWVIGTEDLAEVRLYRDYKQKLWAQRVPGRGSAAIPPAYTTFPQEDDLFVVKTEQGRVLVTHTASGAHWAAVMKQDGS